MASRTIPKSANSTDEPIRIARSGSFVPVPRRLVDFPVCLAGGTDVPRREQQEQDAARDRESTRRERRTEQPANHHRQQVAQGVRQADADEQWCQPVPGSHAQRHQLGLVAKLGHEDEPERRKERTHRADGTGELRS